MTDSEIVRFLAVECMGWILDITEMYWLDPYNKRCCNVRWNPLTSGDDMLMAIEAMGERFGHSTQIFYNGFTDPEAAPHSWSAYVLPRFTEGDGFKGTADTAQRAVCLAAVKALPGENND